MKKIATLVSVIAILLLAGCDSTPNTPETPTPAAPSNPPAEPPVTQVRQISMETGNFYFKPNSLTVKVNQPVKINFTNSGTHNFSLDAFGISQNMQGSTSSVTFTPNKTGTFQFFCNVGKHASMGQVGTLIVTE